MYTTGEDVVCIYQDASLDGFAGAWCLWRTYPNATFVPATNAGPHLDVAGKHVYVIDLWYPMNVLAGIAQSAESVRIIDHHPAFHQELANYQGPFPANLHIIFDTESSGGGMTWDFFNFHQPRPAIINYIEDRALWRFRYPETRAITATLQSYPQNFGLWDHLIFEADLSQLLQEGEVLLRKQQRDIDQAISTTRRRVLVEGYEVPVVNLHPGIASDACSQLARGEAFAVGYWDTPQGRKFSLHSTDRGVDVSQLARHYGGTGTHNVADFLVPHGHPLSHL